MVYHLEHSINAFNDARYGHELVACYVLCLLVGLGLAWLTRTPQTYPVIFTVLFAAVIGLWVLMETPERTIGLLPNPVPYLAAGATLAIGGSGLLASLLLRNSQREMNSTDQVT